MMANDVKHWTTHVSQVHVSFLLCLQECLKRSILRTVYQNVHSRVQIALYGRCLKNDRLIRRHLFS
jgi:hypothetical protein